MTTNGCIGEEYEVHREPSFGWHIKVGIVRNSSATG